LICRGEFLTLLPVTGSSVGWKKWIPDRMKAAINTIRNKGNKVFRVFIIPQTTLENYIKDRQKSSSETVKIKLGSKQVLPCETENDVAEHSLLMERDFFWLDTVDVMRLAYQLSVRN